MSRFDRQEISDICLAPAMAAAGPNEPAKAQVQDRPFVSIIIVNYNGIEVLPKCLLALDKLDYPPCELILIDNGSKDGSVEYADSFASRHSLHILRFPENLGLAVARNAAVRVADGQFLAFIDNDGFPEPDWLNAALETFDSNPRIGAVASLVLFEKRPDIVNGLGGGVTPRGFGFDHLYHRPLGFHAFPEKILYPMGCGMILRKEVADQVFPIDKLLVNYYDDVEIGIRTWNSGYRVEPCAKAIVKHAFNHSSVKNHPLRKEIVCHRNRLRTALKYWPLSTLPSLFLGEFKSLRSFRKRNPGSFSEIFLWNIRHIGSALAIRSRFPGAVDFDLPAALMPGEMPGYPTNTDFAPNWETALPVMDIERGDHRNSLNFGWYFPEAIDGTRLRYTADIASAFLKTEQATNCFLFRFLPCSEMPFTVELREKVGGKILYEWEFSGEIFKILAVSRPVSLPPGYYQVVIRCDFAEHLGGRLLGVSVNFIGLWNVS